VEARESSRVGRKLPLCLSDASPNPLGGRRLLSFWRCIWRDTKFSAAALGLDGSFLPFRENGLVSGGRLEVL